MEKEKTCKELVRRNFRGRMDELNRMAKEAQSDDETTREAAYQEQAEYGLCFDYVPAETWEEQRAGYFRYQLGWGGPSDEFRFFCDPQQKVVKIQYWYLDWFDGAKINLKGADLEFMEAWFEDMKDCGMIEKLLTEANEAA